MRMQEVVSSHPSFTDEITNSPRFSVDEGIYGVWLSENGRRRMG